MCDSLDCSAVPSARLHLLQAENVMHVTSPTNAFLRMESNSSEWAAQTMSCRYGHGKERLSPSSRTLEQKYKCYLSKRACADGVDCNSINNYWLGLKPDGKKKAEVYWRHISQSWHPALHARFGAAAWIDGVALALALSMCGNQAVVEQLIGRRA